MPRPSSTASAKDSGPYTQLEQRLVLLAWLNRQLGYKNNAEMLRHLSGVGEGYDATGHSFVYYHLLGRGSALRLPPAAVARYDDNIRTHLAALNRGRAQPITLRYFQHLAALCTEIVLDRLFNHREAWLAELNKFVQERLAAKRLNDPPDNFFDDTDLNKLAYWMATGSGKTLLLHLNYHQFLHYTGKKLPNNILLITPNEGLSEQHLTELTASGIPAVRFSPNVSQTALSQSTVQIIEITKLVQEKRGGGQSVPVETFGENNLIFVDEGHKGTGGEVWRRYREALGHKGFTFEYSATFGQALSARRDDSLTAEYGKAIVFDYSYRYFYNDGYGKDFRILNLQDDRQEAANDILLLGNLLSFYEQLTLFQQAQAAIRPYNLEKPLWVFVGSTVNAVYTENKHKRSDVLTVVRFLHRVLQANAAWVLAGLEKLLAGHSGLMTPAGGDVFAGRFAYVRERNLPLAELYKDILQQVFGAPGAGGLYLSELRGRSGELGLRAAGAPRHFGVIYIGDTAEFKKLVQADDAGVRLDDEALTASLFDLINQPDSPVHILIGARKFMEGWNSWRVSSMGLLNIGRQEGAQIIQLFGRGVRLKGRDWSLKRSAAQDGYVHPPHLKLLETLNLFAVRANYMAQFRAYLEREGVPTEDSLQLTLPVQYTLDKSMLAQQQLLLPRLDSNRDFVREVSLTLKPDEQVQVQLNLLTTMYVLESSAQGVQTAHLPAHAVAPQPAQQADLRWVDWESVYLEVSAYVRNRQWDNLAVTAQALRTIIMAGCCHLLAGDDVLKPEFAQRHRLQTAITRVLCRYAEKFYRLKREAWEDTCLTYHPLTTDDPNLAFNREVLPTNDQAQVQEARAAYVLTVPLNVQADVKAIIDDPQAVQASNEAPPLPRLNFERHLYQPLLVKGQTDGLTANPPLLEPSETRLVRELQDYCLKNAANLQGKQLFLLRNLSRGRGVGFFEGRKFYPDFILWVLDDGGQRVVFIEPHGMIHAEAYANDDKARLWERLRTLTEKLGQPQVRLDAYIISETSFNDLRNRYGTGQWTEKDFADKHILFFDNQHNYLAHIIRGA